LVRLTDLDMPVPGFGVRVTGTGPDGRFEFAAVPPGRYRLSARTGPERQVIVEDGPAGAKVMMKFTAAAREGPVPPGDGHPFAPLPTDTRWASTDVTVTGPDIAPVSLVLRPAMVVTGRVEFDATGERPADLSSFRVALTSADLNDPGLSTSMAEVGDDGGFAIAGVAPGVYRVTVLSTTGWRAKSFVVDGRYALDYLLSIEPGASALDGTLTLTTRPSSLSGTLVDASGRPATEYTIVLFPDDAAYWTPGSRRIQATRPSTAGRFALANLPAGSYRLVAVDDLEDGQWSDPKVLQQLFSAALPILLNDGDHKVQELRVGK
jgi:hypothetical protein